MRIRSHKYTYFALSGYTSIFREGYERPTPDDMSFLKSVRDGRTPGEGEKSIALRAGPPPSERALAGYTFGGSV
jgi:hypothetical protein